MVEYAILLGHNVGLTGLNSASITHIVILAFSALSLMVVGFALKGVWGAVAAIGLGVTGYLYWNNMLPY